MSVIWKMFGTLSAFLLLSALIITCVLAHFDHLNLKEIVDALPVREMKKLEELNERKFADLLLADKEKTMTEAEAETWCHRLKQIKKEIVEKEKNLIAVKRRILGEKKDLEKRKTDLAKSREQKPIIPKLAESLSEMTTESAAALLSELLGGDEEDVRVAQEVILTMAKKEKGSILDELVKKDPEKAILIFKGDLATKDEGGVKG